MFLTKVAMAGRGFRPYFPVRATDSLILRVPLSNPQDTHTMLRQIERQGRRLSHLIADLLQLTSLEQHNVKNCEILVVRASCSLLIPSQKCQGSV
jgi:hypothetical protein